MLRIRPLTRAEPEVGLAVTPERLMRPTDPSGSGDPLSHLSPEALGRLLQIGSEVVSELDHEAVLLRVLEAARELTGARYAALGVLDGSRQELERFLTSGMDESAHRAIGDLPRGRGLLGVLISDPQPLRLTDVGRHPASYGFPIDHPPMRSFLGVPVLVRGEAWGNLYLTEKEGGPFDEADEQAIVVLAALGGHRDPERAPLPQREGAAG